MRVKQYVRDRVFSMLPNPNCTAGYPYTASGNPCMVENPSVTPLRKFRVLGNSTQQTYTGKNLLPPSDIESKVTGRGVTFTKNGDGTYTLDGNCTEVIYFWLGKVTLGEGTYVLSGCPAGGSTNGYRMEIEWGLDVLEETGDGLTITVAAGAQTFFDLYIAIGDGTAAPNLVFRPQLERGTVKTDFEPYVGGISSPSPERPSAIESVGDLVTDAEDGHYGQYRVPVTVQGKNLLSGGRSGWYNVNGFYETTAYGVVTFDADTYPAGTYSISCPVLNGKYVYVNYITEDGKRITNYVAGTVPCTFQLAEGGLIAMQISGDDSSLLDEVLATAQFESGAQVTAYEPYFKETVDLYLDAPLRKAGDAADYIDFDKGIVVRKVGVRSISNTQTWFEWQSGNGSRVIFYLSKDTSGDTLGLFTIGGVEEDWFSVPTQQKQCSNKLYDVDGSSSVYWYPDYTAMGLDGTEETAVADQKLQEWLADIPLKEFTYVLAQPAETAVALPALPFYPHRTHIFTVDTAVPGEIALTYHSFDHKEA